MVSDDDRRRARTAGEDAEAAEGEPQDQFEWGESVALSVEDVWVAYDSAPALRGVSLDVAGGELVALLGPSGSGKTTLLRVIAGLAFTDRGAVRIGDEDASSIPVQRRRIGLVFQHYALFRHMRVEDNVAFGLRVRPRSSRPSAGEIRKRTRALIEIMRLEGLERRFPQQLSGGQRQRVALARALAIQPRVLLLDEPFGALDAKVRRELRRALRDIHDRTGYTTVFVTHDQEEALEIADRVVVMNDGVIEQIGSPDEIYGAPASRFVFEFIGDSNVLPVEVRSGVISFAGRALDLRAGAAGDAAPGGPASAAEVAAARVAAGARRPDGPALLGFRPHHVEVRPSPDGALFGVVIVARQAAGWRRVELRLASGQVVEVDLAEEDRVAVGDRLAVVPTRWMLLDPD